MPVVNALHHRAFQAWHTLHGGFNLAGFHALAVDFQHPVLTVYVVDDAPHVAAGNVAGVEPTVAVEFFRALGVLEIAGAEGAAQHEFAVGIDRRVVACLVNHAGDVLVDADAQRCGVGGFLHLVGHYGAARLAHAEHVEELVALLRVLRGELLAACDDGFQRVACVVELQEHGGAYVAERDAVLSHVFVDGQGIALAPVAQYVYAASAVQHVVAAQNRYEIEG